MSRFTLSDTEVSAVISALLIAQQTKKDDAFVARWRHMQTVMMLYLDEQAARAADVTE